MSLERVNHLAWRRILDETVVLDLRRRRVHAVNETAGRILEWLERPRDRKALLARLPESAVQEGEEFLERLLEEGLIEESGEPATALEEARPESEEGSSETPRLLWSEELPRLAGQSSPPMEIGNRQCVQ